MKELIAAITEDNWKTQSLILADYIEEQRGDLDFTAIAESMRKVGSLGPRHFTIRDQVLYETMKDLKPPEKLWLLGYFQANMRITKKQEILDVLKVEHKELISSLDDQKIEWSIVLWEHDHYFGTNKVLLNSKYLFVERRHWEYPYKYSVQLENGTYLLESIK